MAEKYTYKYMVRQKIWQGFWNQKGPEELGTPLWDMSSVRFDTWEDSVNFVKTLGCDCCSKAPEELKLNKWYSVGYANKAIIRKET